jgi:flagellar assembly protein FliH
MSALNLKMNWSDTIPFGIKLFDVRLLTQAPQQDWRTHIDEREQSAFERGQREGERKLSEQLLQQRNDMVQLQNGVLAGLRNALPQIIQESETALMNLALEAARKFVADMPIDQKMLESVVRESLRQVEDTAGITIQLHPDDLALLRKHNSQILDGLPETGPMKFIASADVTRGGCLVQTRFGLVDARRETKLEQLQHALNT